MQKLLFLDYIDGSVQPKTQPILMQQLIYNILIRINYDNEVTSETWVKTKYDFQDAFEYLEEHGIDEDSSLAFINQLIEDMTIQIYGENIRAHYLSKAKNYIISSSLKNALENADVNISTKILPEKLSAYIEIPDFYDPEGDNILGNWILIEKNGSDRFLQFACITKDSSGELNQLTFAMNLDQSETLEDSYNKSIQDHLILPDYPGRRAQRLKSKDYQEKNWVKTLINATIYITNSSEDLLEDINKFAAKKSKREGQKRCYTSKPFIILGNSFERICLETGKEFEVRGYFRWQPCGKNWSKLKLTFVRPHTKKRNTFSETSEIYKEADPY